MENERANPIWGSDQPPSIENVIEAFINAESVCVVDEPELPGMDFPEGTYRINITETLRWQIVESLKQFKHERDLMQEKIDTNVAIELKKHIPKAYFAKNLMENINIFSTCSYKAQAYKSQLLKLIRAFETLEKFI